MPDQSIVTAGGRVLNITAVADDTEAARKAAYGVIEQIHFSTCHYRRDIAASPAQALISSNV
jgi:phosphoribosylamine--glycine ligase